jgi:hypothetical protein
MFVTKAIQCALLPVPSEFRSLGGSHEPAQEMPLCIGLVVHCVPRPRAALHAANYIRSGIGIFARILITLLIIQMFSRGSLNLQVKGKPE